MHLTSHVQKEIVSCNNLETSQFYGLSCDKPVGLLTEIMFRVNEEKASWSWPLDFSRHFSDKVLFMLLMAFSLAKWSPRCNHLVNFSDLIKINLEQINFGTEAHSEGPLAEIIKKKCGKKGCCGSEGALCPVSRKSRALTEVALTWWGQSRQPNSHVYKGCSQGAQLQEYGKQRDVCQKDMVWQGWISLPHLSEQLICWLPSRRQI